MKNVSKEILDNYIWKKKKKSCWRFFFFFFVIINIQDLFVVVVVFSLNNSPVISERGCVELKKKKKRNAMATSSLVFSGWWQRWLALRQDDVEKLASWCVDLSSILTVYTTWLENQHPDATVLSHSGSLFVIFKTPSSCPLSLSHTDHHNSLIGPHNSPCFLLSPP